MKLVSFPLKRTEILRSVILTVVISVLTLCAVSPLSCAISKDGITLITCETVPELISFSADSASCLSFCFDRNIQLDHLRVCELGGDGTILPCECNSDVFEAAKLVRLLEPTVTGRQYTVEGVVNDMNANSLLFSIGFKGFNDDMAEILICEIRNAYSSKTSQYEYVKFYCMKGGNLSGYEFFTAGDGEEKKFIFPAIKVSKGEYVTIHLRKMLDSEGNYAQKGMIDEINGNKTSSYAVDSSDRSWDFWIDNQKSRISPSDIIILRNTADGRITDAVLLADPKKLDVGWNTKYDKVRNMVENSGVWHDCQGCVSSDISSAVVCSGVTSSSVNKIICRKNFTIPSCSSDWYIKNNSRRKG